MTVAPEVEVLVEPVLPDDWPANGFGPVESLFDALPEPASLAPGTWVGLTRGTSDRGAVVAFVRRALGRRPAARRAVCCAALVARGYEDVGGCDTRDGACAWGRVPRRGTETEGEEGRRRAAPYRPAAAREEG